MAFKLLIALVVIIVIVSVVNSYPAVEGNSKQSICFLPSIKGFCRALIPRWTYNAELGRCVEFKFGGCAGNANNFPTERTCMDACAGIKNN